MLLKGLLQMFGLLLVISISGIALVCWLAPALASLRSKIKGLFVGVGLGKGQSVW
jgi:hypothetical protein